MVIREAVTATPEVVTATLGTAGEVLLMLMG
jgi:hypothetical protein